LAIRAWGGFYRRFKDRATLLDGMLQNWRAGRIAAIEPARACYSWRAARANAKL
jgi:hypothetical protein